MNSGFDNESTTKVNNNISNNSLKAPADSTIEGTAISSQASVEDSAKQETPVEQQAVAE